MLNKLRLFIATPFMVMCFVAGVAFALSFVFASLVAGSDNNKLNKMQGKQ